MNKRQLAGALLGCVTLVCGIASAQDFPSRAIRLVVPFAAGGGSDIIGRVLAQKLSDSMKQPVIVENKPAA